MEGVGGVLHEDGRERGTDDLCSCVHCALKDLVVCCTTVPVPDSDTAGQQGGLGCHQSFA